WFAQYRGDRITMLDTKTGEFKQWPVAPRWSAPYDVAIDKNEEAWTGSMVTDQVTRLNTRTGESVTYLLPRSTNIRRVHVDNSTTPVTFWVGSNHGASIVKLEPLDYGTPRETPLRVPQEVPRPHCARARAGHDQSGVLTARSAHLPPRHRPIRDAVPGIHDR